MALPELDNHDSRIQYYELMLRGEITGMEEISLPAGYHYETYRDGDRDAWIEIEKSAKEFDTWEQGLDAWKRYYAEHTDELPARMAFVVNEAGEKVATATAFYDIRGIDQSGDGWLHWVAVRREDQGKGLSKPLISHVIQIMKRLGYSYAKIPTQTTGEGVSGLGLPAHRKESRQQPGRLAHCETADEPSRAGGAGTGKR